MSYQALARTWRPRTFSQLIGQEHITTPLINALTQQRLHHAYLFTGTRGVGKTSVARILAKALNCESGISATPCLNCATCLAIEQGSFIDLIEIDGASKTRVEDTRDLLDNVPYAPTHGRFKIYLIDEVHMLSQHSFNALLKTLEEPPAHVKFILATTDPQKLPVTILSRCLQFSLRPLSTELIKQQLALILNEEHKLFEQEALSILAKVAQGSMRDALSLLDQAIISNNEQLLASDVKNMLGYSQKDYALHLLRALAEHNTTEIISLSQQIAAEGAYFQYVLDELLTYCHQMTVYKSLGGVNPFIQPTEEIQRLAPQFSLEDLQLFYQIGLKGREELSWAPTIDIGFSMTLLRMHTFRPAPTITTLPQQTPLLHKTSAPETAQPSTAMNTPSNHTLNTQPTNRSAPVAKAQLIDTKPLSEQNKPMSTDKIQVSAITTNNWPDVIPQLKLTGFALNAVENAEFITKQDRIIQLKVARGHLSLFTPSTLSKIEAALSAYCNENVKVELESETQTQASPAQQKEKIMHQKQHNATEALHNDAVFQHIKQEFSAELMKNSVVSLKDDL